MADVARVVELVGVGRTFPGPPEVRALQDIDLVIPRGDYVSILGRPARASRRC